MFKKTIVMAGILFSASSFAAMTELSTPSNGTPCAPEIQKRLMDITQRNFELDKKNLIATNEAKKSIKPQTGLSCLDNLGLAASMGFPSWSRILSSITNQVKNKACTQITQGISSVSGAINQSIGFKGIPGVDGQIIDGSGISISGGVNQSGNTGIYTSGGGFGGGFSSSGVQTPSGGNVPSQPTADPVYLPGEDPNFQHRPTTYESFKSLGSAIYKSIF